MPPDGSHVHSTCSVTLGTIKVCLLLEEEETNREDEDEDEDAYKASERRKTILKRV